jgi:hypothetical protein
VGKEKDTNVIAKECGDSGTTIFNYLKKNNIPKRPYKWSEEENTLLLELSKEMTFLQIAELGILNRTYEAIRIQASKIKAVSPYNPGDMDEDTRKKISCTLRNISLEDFQAFTTRETEKARHSLEYRRWREQVFSRDGWKCVITGLDGPLNAHHIESFSKYPKLRTNINNGISLHEEVHQLLHSLYGDDCNADTLETFKTHPNLIELTKQLKQEYDNTKTHS